MEHSAQLMRMLAAIIVLGVGLETTWQNRLTGRTLFNSLLTWEFMDSALDEGAVIKATRFSQLFTLAAFHAHYGERVHPLFLIDGARIQVLAADSKINPRAGQLVVSLILPKTTERNTSAPANSGSASASSVIAGDARPS